MIPVGSMPPAAEPELPPEVIERLAGAEGIRLQVGRLGSSEPLPAVVAPLAGRLTVLFVPTPAALATLEQTVAATLLASAPDGSWSVQVRGRLLRGPSATVDARRSELMHWVPDGRPGRWAAGRFFPEHVDYQVETPSGRRRATGPVPGLQPLSRRKLYTDLAVEPYALWFLISGVLIAVGILAVAAEDAGSPHVLVLALLAGFGTPVAARVLLAPLDLERFAAGVEEEATLGPLARAWLAPAELRADGLRLAGVAALAWVALVLTGGSVVAALVSLLSGAPVILLALALRRRSTARDEGGGA